MSSNLEITKIRREIGKMRFERFKNVRRQIETRYVVRRFGSPFTVASFLTKKQAEEFVRRQE